jgi:Resolvase, N terminal domain
LTQPRVRKTAAPGRLIGYARVSTEEQGTDPQCDEVRAAGCAIVLEEHASGADRDRPVLARLLRDIAYPPSLLHHTELAPQAGQSDRSARPCHSSQ